MNTRIASSCVILLAVAVALPSVASADLINLTSGPANFQWNPDTSQRGTSLLTAPWKGNAMSSFTPLVRFDAQGLARTASMQAGTFGQIAKDNVLLGANVQRTDIDFTNSVGTLITDVVNVTHTFNLTADGVGNSILDYTMSLSTNNSVGANIPNVSGYLYIDFDVASVAPVNIDTGISATDGSFTGFLQTAANNSSENMFAGTDNFQNWEVAPWAAAGSATAIDFKVLSGNNLSNSGVPFAANDMTLAFGWNAGTLVFGGGPVTFNVRIYSSIPEPSTNIALAIVGLALVVGVCIQRRRRHGTVR